MQRILAATFFIGWLTPLGCESSRPPEANASKPAAIEVPVPATPAPAVTLNIKNWDETLELVAQHKGKVVVLDLWSTSCEPCMVEFPHLVELHKQHGEMLVCLSASCDYAGIKSKPPETYRDRVSADMRHLVVIQKKPVQSSDR